MTALKYSIDINLLDMIYYHNRGLYLCADRYSVYVCTYAALRYNIGDFLNFHLPRVITYLEKNITVYTSS